MFIMEIPNLCQGREKTFKTSAILFEEYILYWSRLFFILVVTLGFMCRKHLGMPEINLVSFNGCKINDLLVISIHV